MLRRLGMDIASCCSQELVEPIVQRRDVPSRAKPWRPARRLDWGCAATRAPPPRSRAASSCARRFAATGSGDHVRKDQLPRQVFRVRLCAASRLQQLSHRRRRAARHLRWLSTAVGGKTQPRPCSPLPRRPWRPRTRSRASRRWACSRSHRYANCSGTRGRRRMAKFPRGSFCGTRWPLEFPGRPREPATFACGQGLQQTETSRGPKLGGPSGRAPRCSLAGMACRQSSHKPSAAMARFICSRSRATRAARRGLCDCEILELQFIWLSEPSINGVPA